MAVLRRYGFSLVLAVALVLVYLQQSGDGQDILQISGYTMGTTYQLQYVPGVVGLPLNQVRDDIADILNRLDRGVFSTYAEQSELSRLNRTPVGQPIRVSSELLEVAMLAETISVLTDGAFDVTVGPLVNLWGFGPEATRERVPTDQQIAVAQQLVGHEFLTIDPSAGSLTRAADIYIDLSGIAKGYAVDEVAGYFDGLGIHDYFLEIGGELKISGLKPGGDFWVPAIERPEDGAPQIYEILNSQGEQLAIAGSGDYRNYFEVDGARYSHEIDPRTGRPIDHRLAAAYVIDAEAARADALATAFMVLGSDEGMKLAESQGLAAFFVVRSAAGFQSLYTREFARFIQVED